MKNQFSTIGLVALSVLASVACGAAPSRAVEDDAGRDAAEQRSDAGASLDAGEKVDTGNESRRDAGKGDASAVDASEPDAKGDAAHADAPAPAVDAGPACMTKVADEDTGVFLMTSAEPATGTCGTRSNPCTDLASALAATSASHLIVYVGNGTYSPVAPATAFPDLPERVTLLGGWNVTSSPSTGYNFAPTCTANATITSAAQAVLTIGTVAPSTSNITLDTLTVTSTAKASTGQSLYGILATGVTASSLVLIHVSVSVPSGGAGAAGANGAAGADGTGTTCTQPAGDGAAGVAGAGGAPAQFGAGGVGSGAQGATGTAGETGATGVSGVQACTPSPETPSCEHIPFNGTGLCIPVAAVTICTATPEGGCGGSGGAGGTGGSGGGSSIAVYSWGDDLVIQAGALTSGPGGAGGGGGVSEGGTGAAGGAASTASYVSPSATCSATTPLNCGPSATSIIASTPGSPGGAGGAGGQGGGGAGGDSFAYYLGNGATASIVGVPTFTVGAVGAGGFPNGPQGVSGTTN